MSPSEREFGELHSDVRNVARAVEELRRTNSQEHAANAKRLERMETSLRDAIAGKADKGWVEDLDDDVEGLKASRNRFEGAKLLLLGSIGAVLTAIGYFIHS